jgi:pyruvate,water dikinase
MDPVQALREMKRRGERDVSAIVERFRHHSAHGLDICQPRWDEDRAFVEALLEDVEPGGGRDPRGDGEAARREAVQRLPRRKRRAFGRKLDRLRRFVWLREQMRDLSSRVYYQLRRHALRIGQQRGLGDDIFFMTFAEVLDDDRSQIERRREVYESFRRFNAPNEIGSRYAFTAAVPRGAMVGIAASRGVARGVARVARTAQEAARVERGAVLVCPFTDPGWTPVLERVAAVVTETGGLLSHAAVICREYGVPAVLAVSGATERIADGARIVVDADRGCVELCENVCEQGRG